MPYIAKVSNTSGVWQAVELRLASNGLLDISFAERADWRLVSENRPIVDNYTQVLTAPQDLVVSDDGASVTMPWSVVSTPTLWSRMRLKDYALQRSTQKASSGLMLPNGIQVATSAEQAGLIVDAIEALERGWLAEPVLFQALNGEWVTLTLEDLKAVGAAIAKFKQAIYLSRKEIYDAIDAERITTGDQIDSVV